SFGATFTFVNNCDYTVWPGILPNAGSPTLSTTGFELPKSSSVSFTSPTGWSGRFWGRTGCSTSQTGQFLCQTGDCGSGQVACSGSSANPPATLAEVTLSSNGPSGLDFYDVSLVDGYNLPMMVEPSGGSGLCGSTGCPADLNRACPSELRASEGDACMSACEAFGTPEYCCSGEYGTPDKCKPSVYSEMFKTACPRSYSYAYDDATSTFTCSGADYTITFCPSSSPSQKSSSYPTPVASGSTTPPSTGYGSGSGSMVYGSSTGAVSESGAGTGTMGSGTETGSGSTSGVMFADGSWLAGLAMGDSTRIISPSLLQSAFMALFSILLCIH
ncbi:Thaumatin family, partial [Dillenia turbinata]